MSFKGGFTPNIAEKDETSEKNFWMDVPSASESNFYGTAEPEVDAAADMGSPYGDAAVEEPVIAQEGEIGDAEIDVNDVLQTGDINSLIAMIDRLRDQGLLPAGDYSVVEIARNGGRVSMSQISALQQIESSVNQVQNEEEGKELQSQIGSAMGMATAFTAVAGAVVAQPTMQMAGAVTGGVNDFSSPADKAFAKLAASIPDSVKKAVEAQVKEPIKAMSGQYAEVFRQNPSLMDIQPDGSVNTRNLASANISGADLNYLNAMAPGTGKAADNMSLAV